MWFVLHRSIYGRYLFAVGRNVAARYWASILSGDYQCLHHHGRGGNRWHRLRFYTNSISPSSHGNFFELYGRRGGTRRLLLWAAAKADHRHFDWDGAAASPAEFVNLLAFLRL